MLTIEGEDQVQVKINVAEVQRSLVKQLGIDLNAQNINIAGLLAQRRYLAALRRQRRTAPGSGGITFPQSYNTVGGGQPGARSGMTINALRAEPACSRLWPSQP